MGLFQAAPTPSTSGLFGNVQQPANSSGLFGISSTSAPSSMFPGATGSTPLFGNTASTNTKPTGTKNIRWRDDFNAESAGHIQAITYLPDVNQSKCIEELRFEDYLLGLTPTKSVNKAGSFSSTAFGGIGQQAPFSSTGGLFSATNPQTSGATGLFGTSAAPSGTGLFGQSSSTTSSALGQPSLGGGLFGGSVPFSGTQKPLASTLNTLSADKPGGLFSGGMPSTSSGLFGTSGSQPITNSGLFGASGSVPPASGMASGMSTGTASAPTGGLFGSGNNAGLFRSSWGTSATPQQNSGGLFGSSSTTQGDSGGLFGGSANKTGRTTGAGLFGTTALPATGGGTPGGGLFGTAATPAQSSQGLFASTVNAPAGGLFGASNTGAPGAGATTSSLFGGGNQPAVGSGSGGSFGGSFLGSTHGTTSGTGLFGTGGGGSSGTLFGGASSTPGFGLKQQPAWGTHSTLLESQSNGRKGGLLGLGEQQSSTGGIFGGINTAGGSQQQQSAAVLGTGALLPSASLNDPYGLCRLSAVYASMLPGAGGMIGHHAPSVPNPFAFPASGVILPTQYRRYKSVALAQVWRPLPEHSTSCRRQLLPSLTPKRLVAQRLGNSPSLPTTSAGLGADYGWPEYSLESCLQSRTAPPSHGGMGDGLSGRRKHFLHGSPASHLNSIFRVSVSDEANRSPTGVAVSASMRSSAPCGYRGSRTAEPHRSGKAQISNHHGTTFPSQFSAYPATSGSGARSAGKRTVSAVTMTPPVRTLVEHCEEDSSDDLNPPWLSKSAYYRRRRSMNDTSLRQGISPGLPSHCRSDKVHNDAGGGVAGDAQREKTLAEAPNGSLENDFGGAVIKAEYSGTRCTGRVALGASETSAVSTQSVCPVECTREGYTTRPSLETLSSYPEWRLAAVEDFTVLREGYGEITWPGLTDVRGLSVDNSVIIEDKAVEVYPEKERSDADGNCVAIPVGVGLNKLALVTLYNCGPKRRDELHLSPEEAKAEYDIHVEKMRLFTKKIGGHFIALTPQWAWKFRVDHFSRYAFLEDNDVEPVDNENKTFKLSAMGVARTGTDKRPRLLEPVGKGVVDGATALQLPPCLGSSSIKCTTDANGAKLYGGGEKNELALEELILHQFCKSFFPELSKGNGDSSGGEAAALQKKLESSRACGAGIAFPVLGIRLPAVTEVSPGLRLGRSDASEERKAYVTHLDQALQCTMDSSDFGSPWAALSSKQCDQLIDLQLEVAVFYAKALERVGDANKEALRLAQYTASTWGLVRLLFGSVGIPCEADCQRAPSTDVGDTVSENGMEKLVRRGDEYSNAKNSCTAESTRNGVQRTGGSMGQEYSNVKDPLEHSLDQCSVHTGRLERLGAWFAEVNAETVDPLLNSLKTTQRDLTLVDPESQLPYEALNRVKRAFYSLTKNDLCGAVSDLLGRNRGHCQIGSGTSVPFYRLALCLVGSGSPSITRAPIHREPHFRQLIEWQKRGIYEQIPIPVLRLHHILAGCVDRLVSSETPDWKTLLSLLLWYPSPDASLYVTSSPTSIDTKEYEEPPRCISSRGKSDSGADGVRNAPIFYTQCRKSQFDHAKEAVCSAVNREAHSRNEEGHEITGKHFIREPTLGPLQSLNRALHIYMERLLKIPNQTATPAPLPFYCPVERRELRSTDHLDVQFSLLRLFAGELEPTEHEKLFYPAAVSKTGRDVALLWPLFRALYPMLLSRNSSGSRDSYESTDNPSGDTLPDGRVSHASLLKRTGILLDSLMVQQLEEAGLWKWCVVLSLSQVAQGNLSDITAVRRILDILLRNTPPVTSSCPSKEFDTPLVCCSYSVQLSFIMGSSVGIPALLITYVHALRYRSSKCHRRAADHWLDCAMIAYEWSTGRRCDTLPSLDDGKGQRQGERNDVNAGSGGEACFIPSPKALEKVAPPLPSVSLFSQTVKSPPSVILSHCLMSPTSLFCQAVLDLLLSKEFLLGIQQLCSRLVGDSRFLWSALCVPSTGAEHTVSSATRNSSHPSGADKSARLTECRREDHAAERYCGTPGVSAQELNDVLKDNVAHQRLALSATKLVRRSVTSLCQELLQQAPLFLLEEEWEKCPALPLCSFVVWVMNIFRCHGYQNCPVPLRAGLICPSRQHSGIPGTDANVGSGKADLSDSCEDGVPSDSTLLTAEMTQLRTTAQYLFALIQRQLGKHRDPKGKIHSKGTSGASPIHLVGDHLQRTSLLPPLLSDIGSLQEEIVPCLQAVQRVVARALQAYSATGRNLRCESTVLNRSRLHEYGYGLILALEMCEDRRP